MVEIVNHTLEGASREQGHLFTSLDDLVASNNPVRLIDALVDKIVLSDPASYILKGTKKNGRKAYSSTLMLKVYVYCYFNSIRSSRSIEKELGRNIELMWLAKNLTPNYWTINEFRKENESAIRKITLAFRKFILGEGFASTAILTTDGCKIKACASPDVLKMETIKKRIVNVEKKINAYLLELSDSENEESVIQNSMDTVVNMKLLAKITELQKQLEKAKEGKLLLELHEKDVLAPNDPQANLMKSRDGIKPGYNAQAITDAQGHFILSAEIKTEANDINLLQQNVNDIKETLGVSPKMLLADGGYANPSDIKALEESENPIECIIPVPEKAARIKDKKAGVDFTFDKEGDIYKCSQGKSLIKVQSNKKKGNAFFDIYQCKDCEGCELKDKCTSSKQGRSIQRSVHAEWFEEYEKRMKEPQNIEWNKKRKTIVEHPFGTIKWIMGKLGFLLTGKKKVQIELDLLTTAYNLKRLVNCDKVETLIEKVNKFNWAEVCLCFFRMKKYFLQAHRSPKSKDRATISLATFTTSNLNSGKKIELRSI